MKTRTYLLAMLIVFTTSFNYAQQDSLQRKLPRFETKLFVGGTNSIVFNQSLENWEKTTPNFLIPDSLIPNDNSSFYGDQGSGLFLISFSFINNWKKQQKFRSSTTIHLGVGSEITASQNWNYSATEVIDTLQSTQNGNAYYVEGVREQVVKKSYRSAAVFFGVGQRISTNPERSFKLETGLDLLFFTSLQGKVSASFQDTYSVQNTVSEYVYTSPVLNEKTSQTYKGQLISGMIIRVPLDFSLRLSKKRNVAKNMRIGWELNPGISTVFNKNTVLSDSFHFSGGVNFRCQF